MYNKKILIVDDEKTINDVISEYLEKEGYKTFSAPDGRTAMKILKSEKPDLIILDIMLPDISGIDLCLEIRKHWNTPILFLSCKAEEIDKIVALSVGGDDYVTKPFLPGELVARVKAHLRRSQGDISREFEEVILEAPGLTVNVTSREVFLDGMPVSLTAKEFDILCLLMKNPRRIYSAIQIFEHAWGVDSMTGDNKTVMVYISTLRKKIENNKNDYKYILSLRGIGYKFNHQLLENKKED
ncbi:MAG: response regulator transcription factor [Clostridia bacterium]|nr:response regulator transcription factor [Clostridia bacterium]